jgi:hypothetical protein
MSERGLGVVEREALDRARTRLVALRAEQYRLLEDIAELERLGVAQQTGDRATPRLLQDLSTLDLHEARRLTEESADLAPRRSLLGSRCLRGCRSRRRSTPPGRSARRTS